MNEEIEIIKNFIINHNLIQLIIPIALPFTLFHFFMKFVRCFTYEIKRGVTTYEFNSDEIKIDENIPDIINNDIVLSNNQFIKY